VVPPPPLFLCRRFKLSSVLSTMSSSSCSSPTYRFVTLSTTKVAILPISAPPERPGCQKEDKAGGLRVQSVHLVSDAKSAALVELSSSASRSGSSTEDTVIEEISCRQVPSREKRK
jgi:hypothetical protein